MTNQEILDKLITRETDAESENIDTNEHSYNSAMVHKYLNEWDTAEPFPITDIKQYIRLNEWKKEDFCPAIEICFSKILPAWFLLVYKQLEFFRQNNRRELTSIQEAFGKLYGHPMSTQDEKAFTLYEYMIQQYINKK